MSLTKSERIFLVVLSVLLLTGAVILHFRQSRPRPEITIVKEGIKEELTLIDHESIRFFSYPGLLFTPIVLYKIWKRKEKKRLSLILCNNLTTLKLFNSAEDFLGASVLPDDDFSHIEKKIQTLSYGRSKKSFTSCTIL